MSNTKLSNGFLSGVVEGFYGRPWSAEQRKELFQFLKRLGMNTFLYAPKDDCKHRRFWRELYSPEECDTLRALIRAADQCGITFVYAISPGLDMTFSKEADLLKNKLMQVSQLGCSSFALLFDDIDIELSVADKQVFQSPAHAQVAVTNAVYDHLADRLRSFLFCPTEYCASRASPDVPSSNYLRTLGSTLLPAIDIMWTGPKVVSKEITVDSVKELAETIKRPPVIWDNIHANDYDPKRIFMGPFSGRSSELRRYLRGVLTNPNCEFEANFVALHTLGRWVRGLETDSFRKTDVENENNTDVYFSDSTGDYNPEEALNEALESWLPAIYKRKRPPLPPVPSVPDPILPPLSLPSAMPLEPVTSLAQPVNSLVEPMDCAPVTEKTAHVPAEDRLTTEELLTFVHLFYMPFEHGTSAVELLEDFHWLKCNAHVVTQPLVDEAERCDWLRRADLFDAAVVRLRSISDKFDLIPNRALLLELSPYVQDMRAVLSILNGYLKWLGCTPGYREMFGSGDYEPWMFRGGLAAEFQRLLPLDAAQDLLIHKMPEPASKQPVFVVRPYLPADRSNLYTLCQHRRPVPDPELSGDRFLGLFLEHSPEYCFVLEDELGICACVCAALDANKVLTQAREGFFPKMRTKYPQMSAGKNDAEQDRMSTDSKDTESTLSIEFINFFYEEQESAVEGVVSRFPSLVHMEVAPGRFGTEPEFIPFRRLLACCFAALKTNGSAGAHLRIPADEIRPVEFARRFGFLEMSFATPEQERPANTALLGRAL